MKSNVSEASLTDGGTGESGGMFKMRDIDTFI